MRHLSADGPRSHAGGSRGRGGSPRSRRARRLRQTRHVGVAASRGSGRSRKDRVYGLTTGFGNFADVAIPPERDRDLQRNLVRSHAAGVGHRCRIAIVRAMMALRANALARGILWHPRRDGREASRDAESRHAADRPGAGLRRSVGRPRASRPPRARLDRRRTVRWRGRTLPAARAWKGLRRAPVVLQRKRGPRPDQRSADVGRRRRPGPAARSPARPRGGSLWGRFSGCRPRLGRGLRPAHRGGASPPGSHRVREESEVAARGERDPRVAPGMRKGPGQLRPALHAPGPRSRARRVRARSNGARARDEQRDRQSAHLRVERGRSSPAETSTAPPLASFSTTRRSPRPTWRPSPSGGSRSCSTPPSPVSRPSWWRTAGSTRA